MRLTHFRAPLDPSARLRLDSENAHAEALHAGGRGKSFAPIAELALCSFSPCDLVLIHYIRGSYSASFRSSINLDITIFIFKSGRHRSVMRDGEIRPSGIYRRRISRINVKIAAGKISLFERGRFKLKTF